MEPSRLRTTELAAALTPTHLDTTVPATPLWTARQLVAHLSGAAADVVAGRTNRVGTPPWTAAQATARAGHPPDAVLARGEGAPDCRRATVPQRHCANVA